MKELIAFLDNDPTEKFVVIFDDLARFARDVLVHIKLKTEFGSRGARLECLNFNFEDSEESEFAELIMAASYQYQRKQNRRQVIQKQKARLETGYWSFCTPPALYNIKHLLHGKLLTPKEPFATIYKEAIEQYAYDGLNTLQEVREYILKRYEEHSIKRPLSLNGVQRILTNVLYCGWIEYKPWGVALRKAQHEGFITKELFDKVQAKLNGKSKPQLRKDYNRDFPLRGFIICGSCQNLYTASWNRGRSKYYPNYVCHADGCPYRYRSINKYKIELDFEELLHRVRPHKALFNEAESVFTEVFEAEKQAYLKSKSGLSDVVARIETDIERLIDRVAKTDDEAIVKLYENQITTLTEKKKRVQKEYSLELYTQSDFGTAMNLVFDYLKEPVRMWKNEKLEYKRTIVYMYFDDKLPYDREKGFGTIELAYPIELIRSFSDPKIRHVEMAGVEPASAKEV